jgi:alpha 1,2-mannosyltransferase
MPAIPVRVRLAGIALLAILLVHLSAVHIVPESTYAQKTALSKWTSSGGFRDDRATVEQIYRDGEDKAALTNATHAPRANAAFVILARNTDLWSIMESIRSMEDRFNRKYKCGQRDSGSRGIDGGRLC